MVLFAFVIIFAILNFAVLEQSRKNFVDVIQGIQTEGFGFSGVQPMTSYLYPVDSSGRVNILDFNSDGSQRRVPLQDQFVQSFQRSLLGVGFLAIVAAIIVGILISKYTTEPLNKLSDGIKNLRQEKYKNNLDLTGNIEIDQLTEEFNKLTTELEKLESLRKDLISDTSHELKTPISSLIGQIEGMKDKVLNIDNDRLNLLLTQVNRLNDLVERLQEFSRIRGRKYNLEITNFRLKDLFEELKNVFTKDLEKSGITLNINIDEQFVLSGDKKLLERAFSNLITNAIRYSQGKNITIEVKDKKIIFKDDGVGVPEVHLPYLFERFYRVEKSRNRETGGLGLGLSIVKEIIEAHGWEIEARNERGLGVEVNFKF